MILPFKKLTVDDHTIEIRVRKSKSRTREGYGFAGEYLNNRVDIAPNLPAEDTKRTLWCELIHASFDKSGLRETYSLRTEEYIVHEFGNWLFELLEQNPKLRSYLFD